MKHFLFFILSICFSGFCYGITIDSDMTAEQQDKVEREFWLKVYDNDLSKMNDQVRLDDDRNYDILRESREYIQTLTQKYLTESCESRKKRKLKCIEKCDGWCFPLYSSPDLSAKVVAINPWDPFYLASKKHFDKPTYYNENVNIETDGYGFLVGLNVIHKVQNGRVYEWMQIPPMGSGQEIWFPVMYNGNYDAPKGSKDGDILPYRLDKSFLRSLKYNRLTSATCIQDISNGVVSFYGFAIPLNKSENEYYVDQILEKNKIGYKWWGADIVRTDYEKIEDQIKAIPRNAAEGFHGNTYVAKYVEEVKSYPPLLMKMPLVDFLMNKRIFHHVYEWLGDEKGYSYGRKSIDCMEFKDFLLKDMPQEKKIDVISRNKEIFTLMFSVRTRPPTGLDHDVRECNERYNRYFLKTNGNKPILDDLLARYIYWPNPIPEPVVDKKK